MSLSLSIATRANGFCRAISYKLFLPEVRSPTGFRVEIRYRKMDTSGPFDTSTPRSSHTWASMISPTWWRRASHNRERFSLSCSDTQAALMWPARVCKHKFNIWIKIFKTITHYLTIYLSIFVDNGHSLMIYRYWQRWCQKPSLLCLCRLPSTPAARPPWHRRWRRPSHPAPGPWAGRGRRAAWNHMGHRREWWWMSDAILLEILGYLFCLVLTFICFYNTSTVVYGTNLRDVGLLM